MTSYLIRLFACYLPSKSKSRTWEDGGCDQWDQDTKNKHILTYQKQCLHLVLFVRVRRGMKGGRQRLGGMIEVWGSGEMEKLDRKQFSSNVVEQFALPVSLIFPLVVINFFNDSSRRRVEMEREGGQDREEEFLVYSFRCCSSA